MSLKLKAYIDHLNFREYDHIVNIYKLVHFLFYFKVFK